MILCRVIGNLVSTVKEKGYEGRKIMFVQPVTPTGTPKGTSFLALDTVQAGIGDLVIVIEEGGSARTILQESETFTVKSVIAGVVDAVETEK